MSKIEYRLSELATEEHLEWLDKLVTKILNCCNDRIVLHVDFDSSVDNSAFYAFLNDIHTQRGKDCNKTFARIEEYVKSNKNTEINNIFSNKEFLEQIESLMNCIEFANIDKAKGEKNSPYTEADIQRELGKVFYIWCKLQENK